MRVLLTTDTVGGVWTYTNVLAEELLDQGHSVALVSFGAAPSPDQLAWATSRQQSARDLFRYIPSEIPLEWMPDNDAVLGAGTSVLRQVASDFSPDLLHCNQFCFGAVDLALPRLVVAHSDVLSWAAACAPAGLPQSAWLDRYTQLVQDGLNGADMLVAPTQWMLHALTSHFSVPSPRRVIPNGRTLPQLTRSVPRKTRAATAGRMWDPAKNLAALQKFCACPLLIAGSSGADAAAMDFAASTTLLGVLPEHQLLDLFHGSRIYLAASLYEPFGLAALEAALCGCVIVANDLASFREVWGSAALYFRTPAELHAHAASLLNDDEAFTRMQTLSLARAGTYSAHAMTANYISLYGDLLRAHASPQTSADPSCTYVN